jgi:predicted DNA-binding transcriptional regulator AlpA
MPQLRLTRLESDDAPVKEQPTNAGRGPSSQGNPLPAPKRRRKSPRRELLRAERACRLCDVSIATWWRWDAAGKIPAGIKISPGTKRWRRDELEAWIRAKCPDRRTWQAMNKTEC